MGFVREPNIFKITWAEGLDLHGLEIRAKSVPLAQFLKIYNLTKDVKSDDDISLEDMEQLFEMFSEVLVSWNLEEPGTRGKKKPVPATKSGLYSQDLSFVMTVITQWVAVAAGVSDDEGGDLGKDSTSGTTSPEASLELATLSKSLAS